MNEPELNIGEKGMKINDLPPASYLHECFQCDPEIGVLIWKERPESHFPNNTTMRQWNSRRAGSVAGASNPRGYRVVALMKECGNQVMVHRILWTMFVGPIPDGKQVDHKNGDPTDNRLVNLRLATNRQNSLNSRRKTGKRLGKYPKGVYPSLKKWAAQITINYKRCYLGTFETIEEAANAYQIAYLEVAGEFAKVEVVAQDLLEPPQRRE